jgi:uncharacterized protein
MKRWKKITLGAFVLILGIVVFGAYRWFHRELPPISVAEPGGGGQRIMLGDAPANYYRPTGAGSHPAILLLGGSEGSLREARNVYARALAAEGYAVLYASYYMTSESNRSLNMVPLETFDRALAWMSAQSEIDQTRIAIIGHSKGAEAALIVATRRPEIRAVVAAMPSDVAWQGFDTNATDMSQFSSSWSIAGRPVPFLPYETLAWHQWFSEDALIRMFRQSWAQSDRHPQSRINIGAIRAQMFLICGGEDMVWPSCDMARAIRSRAVQASHQEPVLLRYPDAGHWAFGPVSGLHRTDERGLGVMGGTAQSDMAARRDQWPKLLDFLDRTLNSSRQ